MIKMIGRFAFVLAVVAAVALPAQANSKYKKYMQQSLGDLLLSCVEGDDNACYFYAGMQAKQGNFKEAHDAYLIGAQNAKNRAGFVCMFQLARLYEHGQGVDQDLVQAYRWYSVLSRLSAQQDLQIAAKTQQQALSATMTPQQITLADALSKRGVRIN
jgi:TPR repeat protein